MHKFISKDPIGLAGGDVNFYAYVQNNPVNRIDPSGLNPLLSVIERIAPYLPALNRWIPRIGDELWGDGRPGYKDLLSSPPKDPLPIDPNNPAFKNYNTPTNKPKNNDIPNACTG
jgi:hypothetical protein